MSTPVNELEKQFGKLQAQDHHVYRLCQIKWYRLEKALVIKVGISGLFNLEVYELVFSTETWQPFKC